MAPDTRLTVAVKHLASTARFSAKLIHHLAAALGDEGLRKVMAEPMTAIQIHELACTLTGEAGEADAAAFWSRIPGGPELDTTEAFH